MSRIAVFIKKIGKVRAVTALVLFALVMLTVAFIISNSMQSADVSSGQSGRIVKLVIKVLFGRNTELQSVEFVDTVTYYVRKLAHFAEFFLLSFLCFLLCKTLYMKNHKCFLVSSILAFGVGCVDETVQFFSPGRACRFTDVMIDTFGGICGCVIVLVVFYVLNLFVRKKNGKI